MRFDPSKRRLITGARDGTVRIWNFNNGCCLRELQAVDDQEVICTVKFIWTLNQSLQKSCKLIILAVWFEPLILPCLLVICYHQIKDNVKKVKNTWGTQTVWPMCDLLLITSFINQECRSKMNYIQGKQAEKVPYAEFQFFCTHHNQLNRARLIIVGSIFQRHSLGSAPPETRGQEERRLRTENRLVISLQQLLSLELANWTCRGYKFLDSILCT